MSKRSSSPARTLHGGAIALLVDVVGTLALLGRDPTRPGVSVEMCAAHMANIAACQNAAPNLVLLATLIHRNQSFCAAAKEGEQLLITGKVLRYGKKLGFTEVAIRTDADRLIAVGRHTKFFA